MKGFLMFIIIYVSVVIGNAGFLNADLRSEDYKYFCTEEYGRKNLAFSIAISTIPIVSWIIVTPIATGFYYHGWTLKYGSFGQCKQRGE